MESITRPILPPKPGYVETIDAEGNHIYTPTPETVARLEREAKMSDQMNALEGNLNTLLNASSETASQAALDINRAIQIFASTITDESVMMQIPNVYPEYQVGVSYKIKDIFRWGVNSVGDPQLYQVLQDHVSAAEWTPDTAASLYKKIGVTESGIPEWVQPVGATDAYGKGDVVMYNGKKYESLIDANVWSPDAYPAGWKLVET